MTLKQAMESMLPEIEEELKQVVQRTTSDRYPQLRGMLAYHMGWEGEGAGRGGTGQAHSPAAGAAVRAGRRSGLALLRCLPPRRWSCCTIFH